MSDIQKAVEAAWECLQGKVSCHLPDTEHLMVISYGDLEASLISALPHLASSQPQPSKSDEEAARNLDVDLFWMRDTGNGDAREQLRGRPARLLLFRAFAEAGRADERAAALAECEAIARDEARMWGKEVGSSALAAADRIAALPRGLAG